MSSKTETRVGSNGAAPCDLLVRNAVVVTMDAERRVFSRGAVAVSGPSIVDVGTERALVERYRPARVLDARGAAVHPGFIDAHIHIVHGTARGVFADVVAAAGERVSFADWKAGVDPEDEHAATAFAGLDLLKNAFTAFVEPGTVFDTDAAADAARSVGVRALLSGCYIRSPRNTSTTACWKRCTEPSQNGTKHVSIPAASRTLAFSWTCRANSMSCSKTRRISVAA